MRLGVQSSSGRSDRFGRNEFEVCAILVPTHIDSIGKVLVEESSSQLTRVRGSSWVQSKVVTESEPTSAVGGLHVNR